MAGRKPHARLRHPLDNEVIASLARLDAALPPLIADLNTGLARLDAAVPPLARGRSDHELRFQYANVLVRLKAAVTQSARLRAYITGGER